VATAVSTYAFINAKLRARISKLLNEEFFLSMARARSLVEAVSMLERTPYSEVVQTYKRTGDIKLCELDLARSEHTALSSLGKYTPETLKPFTQAILDHYTVLALKNALRLWFERVIRGRPIDDKVAYLVSEEGIAAAPVDPIINAEGVDEIVAALEGSSYAVVAEPLATLSDESSLFRTEVALDKVYYERLLAAAGTLNRTDSAVAFRLIGVQIDMLNVNWVVRIKRFREVEERDLEASLLPGGAFLSREQLRDAYRSEGTLEKLIGGLGPRYSSIVRQVSPDAERNQLRRLALLQDLLRSILFQEIHRVLGGYPFTVGVILAYYLLVQNEVRTVASVLNARAYDLPTERTEALI
jgi:V/A-type H+-transporting ATPase subunit C